MDCSPPGSSVRGNCAGKNAGVGCPCLPQGDPTMKERVMRKPIWADKEVSEPRDQRLRTSWWNAIWDSCVLISFYVKVKMLRATKPVPGEGRGELRRAESARKPSRFSLDSPEGTSLLLRLQGCLHVYTQGAICYFAAWLIINPPMCWSNWIPVPLLSLGVNIVKS